MDREKIRARICSGDRSIIKRAQKKEKQSKEKGGR